MKRAITAFVVCLVAFSAVQARPPTETEVIWSFMIGLSPANAADKGESAVLELRDSELSDAAIQRLQNYSIDAMKQSDNLGKQSYQELCALKGGPPAAIADQITKMVAEERALMDNQVANIGLVLSDEEQRALYRLLSDRSSHMEVGGDEAFGDLTFALRNGMVDVDEYMEQICPTTAKEPAGPASPAPVTSK
jgi:hypothetical protein